MAKKPKETDIGHNSETADRDRRILFGHYHRKDRDLAAKIKALQTEKSANRQNAKASGFPAQKLDHYLKTFLAEDQQKPVEKHRSEAENLMWQGLIPDTSGDLLAQVDRVDHEGMVRARGFHAGLNALDKVSGYDAGSSDDVLWRDSYEAGLAEYNTYIPDILARLDDAAKKEEPAAEEYASDPF